MKRFFIETDELANLIKIKRIDDCQEPIAYIATPKNVFAKGNEARLSRAMKKAHLLASVPDLFNSLEAIVKLFDPEKQAIYSFTKKELDTAKKLIDKLKEYNDDNRSSK